MFGNLDVPLRNTLQKRTLPTAILTQQAIPIPIIQANLGTLNQQPTMETQAILINLDIPTLGIGNQDAVRGTVRRRREFRHLSGSAVRDVFGGAVGGEVGHGCAGGGDVG